MRGDSRILNGNFFTYIKENKNFRRALILISIGIALIFVSSSFGKTEEKSPEGITLDEYKIRLEDEIASICSDVSGVGKCRVFITLERGEQNVYKGSSVIETKPPRVLGVTVVCRGADSDRVRSELTDMLTALFDIGSNRVAILKLNS